MGKKNNRDMPGTKNDNRVKPGKIKKAMATSATAGKKKNEDIDTREDLTA